VKRPPILIFDEATSSIDVGGEKVVQAALDRISKDRTTIMIAHRLSTVRRADKIIVIRDGINIEDGTHEELIHSQGIYHSMVHAQQLEPLTDLGKDESSGYSELPVKEQINSEEGYIHEIEDNEAPPMEQRAKKFGFFRSFGIIAWEQRSHWILYILIGVGAIGAGCRCYIFCLYDQD
jgi:ABC-type multidrug transport system ATPase subunit